MKRVMIIGIHGMDGSHLADFLLQKGYIVFGLQYTEKQKSNIDHIRDKITLLNGNLNNIKTLKECIQISSPDEIYNLGGVSFLDDCWMNTENNASVMGMGVLRLLEAVKDTNKNIKIFQASSSEMYGRTDLKLIDENTPMCPNTQYGCSKCYAHMLCNHYRNTYDMFISCGILFNHESERRKNKFLTRKITEGVAKIKLGLVDHIALGNIESERDWSYAPDFVEGFWKMLQHEQPGDFILSSNKLRSIQEFLTTAFQFIKISDWQNYIKLDKSFTRPSESRSFAGNHNKANQLLNWSSKTSFEQMIQIMVNNDIKLNSYE